MEFHERRRQQFLNERHYGEQIAFDDEVLAGQRKNLLEPERGERGWHCSLFQGIAQTMFIKLCLHYTAGEPIESLSAQLAEVVTAYERYGESLWKYESNPNEPVFTFTSIDDYCELMQIIGLCFLLHRRDLLPRIAAMQDGVDGENGGVDTLFEEFMAYAVGSENRYESDWLCASKPYESLFHALTETTPEKQLAELQRFLKRWYKDLAGCGWHDSHKPDEAGNQGGYYGYWSFEAGAAVLLLGIEDDSSLHQYLYYPKDLVAWARTQVNHPGGAEGGMQTALTSTPGGQPCPQAGWWFTPAKQGSRRYFNSGEVMPIIEGSDYGATFWQWDIDQTAPKL